MDKGYTKNSCKTCKQKLAYTKTVRVRDDLQYLYDLPRRSYLAYQIKDDWVGVSQEAHTYCRLCIRKRRIIFLADWAR